MVDLAKWGPTEQATPSPSPAPLLLGAFSARPALQSDPTLSWHSAGPALQGSGPRSGVQS